ncbi:MAG: hypothetical protein LBL94_08640 [Prevotellaceae bacterium]|jgi:hypothetical protein|nr:hypothetical protein [Prevotellaceae bacterium]
MKNISKYIAIVLLLTAYMNRGLFVAPAEMESSKQAEVNSLCELLVRLIVGNHNDVDEDGDLSESYSAAKIAQPFISQQFSQLLELRSKFSIKIEKIFPPTNEAILQLSCLDQVDHPPKG